MKLGPGVSELWGSKVALSHWFGPWLIQQLVLTYKPWYITSTIPSKQFGFPHCSFHPVRSNEQHAYQRAKRNLESPPFFHEVATESRTLRTTMRQVRMVYLLLQAGIPYISSSLPDIICNTVYISLTYHHNHPAKCLSNGKMQTREVAGLEQVPYRRYDFFAR